MPAPQGLIDELPGRLEAVTHTNLVAGEQVFVKLKGAFKEALVCTDRRVLIVKTGFMTGQTFGSNIFQLPYKSIGSVEVKFGLTGYFEVSAIGMQNTLKTYWSNRDDGTSAKKSPNCISLVDAKCARRFRHACTVILEMQADSAMSAPTATAQAVLPKYSEATSRTSIFNDALALLEQLGVLRDSGVVTAEEFDTKKRELLARL